MVQGTTIALLALFAMASADLKDDITYDVKNLVKKELDVIKTFTDEAMADMTKYAPADPSGSCYVQVFQHWQYKGKSYKAFGNVALLPTVNGYRWNDQISSFKLPDGCCVEIFDNANYNFHSPRGNYAGKKGKYCHSVSFVGKNWNDQMSSLKVSRQGSPAGMVEVGCYVDKPSRAISGGIKNYNPAEIIKKCYEQAMKAGNHYFAVQNQNECFTSYHAGATYNKYGKGTGCHHGRGGGWRQTVYKTVPRCDGANGGCCTKKTPCGLGDGDCDYNHDCAGSLVCGYNNCHLPWGDSTDDCCISKTLRCVGANGGCCTKNTPCGVGDGDCDFDHDCAGNLKCGYNNCHLPWGDSTDDCCMKPFACKAKEYCAQRMTDSHGRQITYHGSEEHVKKACEADKNCVAYDYTAHFKKGYGHPCKTKGTRPYKHYKFCTN